MHILHKPIYYIYEDKLLSKLKFYFIFLKTVYIKKTKLKIRFLLFMKSYLILILLDFYLSHFDVKLMKFFTTATSESAYMNCTLNSFVARIIT